MSEKKTDAPPMTPTEALNVMIVGLRESIMREVQANAGQVDIASLLVNQQMLVENIQMLTALVIQLSNGECDKLTDDDATNILAARIKNNIAERDAVTNKSRLVQAVRAVPDPRFMNGSRNGPRR